MTSASPIHAVLSVPPVSKADGAGVKASPFFKLIKLFKEKINASIFR